MIIEDYDKPTSEGIKRYPRQDGYGYGYGHDWDGCICKPTCENPCAGFSWRNETGDGCECHCCGALVLDAMECD